MPLFSVLHMLINTFGELFFFFLFFDNAYIKDLHKSSGMIFKKILMF